MGSHRDNDSAARFQDSIDLFQDILSVRYMVRRRDNRCGLERPVVKRKLGRVLCHEVHARPRVDVNTIPLPRLGSNQLIRAATDINLLTPVNGAQS